MSPCEKKKCYVILKCTFFVYLFIQFKVTGTVQIRGISVTCRTFRRTGHLKVKQCNRQRLKQDNNVIQLEGTHKTLKKQDKTSLKTGYADASQNARCRRRRHTDVGLRDVGQRSNARHVKASQQPIQQRSRRWLKPFIATNGIQSGSALMAPLFFLIWQQHAASHQGAQRRNFVFVQRSGTQVGSWTPGDFREI